MLRKVGFLLTGAGVLLLAWLAVTMWWGDPITSLYTRYEQHKLASTLSTIESKWATESRPSPASRRISLSARRLLTTKAEATAFDRALHDGEPIGRITIPRLGLSMIVIQGTSTSDLEKGPGHYDAGSGESTVLPGMGGVIAIAGHRTTFLHPFRHIDELKSGDQITLAMPYGTFHYRVYRHEVVLSDDWSILRHRPFEELVLSACHPLYSATHRWVVFARLVSSNT